MSVTVAATWSGSLAMPGSYVFPPPAAKPLTVGVANTAGDWMVALVTWRQPQAGAGVTVSVADDAHNWWEPLGAPSGDSSAAGVTRCAIWVAPAARAAANVQVAPTGPYLSLAVLILDLAGMSPWSAASAVSTGFASAATSLSVGIGAPASSAFMLALTGADSLSFVISGPGAGWSAQSIITASNGTDTTADLQLTAAWQTASTAQSAAWTSAGSIDMSGVTAGILIAGTPPAAASPGWPVVITEAAIGAGALTPPSQLSWTSLSARKLATQVQQGRQYTLSALQAGQGTMTIDNPDGALIPPGTGSFAGIDSGTPVRMRVIIPSLASPHYVPFSGFFKRWPFAVPGDMLRGQTVAEITDIWGYANGVLNSMAIEESLLDSPYALWPMTDPAGSAGASNIAPGNSNPLVLTQSKYGAAGAKQAWGQNTSSGLVGAASAKVTASGKAGGAAGMFGQTLAGTSLNTNGYGWALGCADANYPPIAGGVTLECWFQDITNSATAGVTAFGAATAGSLFTNNNATYANGDPVVLSVATGFSLPGGFSAGVVYYVINQSGATFQLAATLGGAAITVTSAGSGYMQVTTPWIPVVLNARNVSGTVIEIVVSNTTGALLMRYKPAGGTVTAVTVDSSIDYRAAAGMTYVAVAFNQAGYRVTWGFSGVHTISGTFSSPLPATFNELWFCGIQDRATQGFAYSGYTTMGAVYPLMLATSRVYAHYLYTGFGASNENASDRIEDICEYAGLTGRRLILPGNFALESDTTASGQDIGGQAAASAASNIAASTIPAMLYVAPTGDLTYLSKAYSWNQPVKWVLGDGGITGAILDEAGNPILDEAGNILLSEAGAVEIPFAPAQFTTDYDPSRLVAGVQLTQLDTQSVTIPAGVMAATTMAALAAAAGKQYGAAVYQQTAYLNEDWSAAYGAGSGLSDLGNWLQGIYAKPANRVQAVTVEAFANSANAFSQLAWQFWAGASAGDMVTVNLRLPTAATSPLISLTARITQTQRQMQWSQDGTSARITCVLDFAPEYNALTADDPVRGLLNGTNVLAW